ncbi:TPA: hypothetical protein ACXDAY_002091 [Clostridium botulinum]|uniref:hypothetical protein n=1 Tax=Clostridium botulinum TaxID=1491 RepID=UPI00077433E8|nr:hypothetical protein [Clostridium botulinum]APR02351.1 hypothetical protein RSJ2_4098 [Clostridium botulinum]AUN01609.1 hypothetical protein RSJ19_01120 [Clostridium botulinum]MBN3359328.1 hypothetical protein [Clostridium botulinum]MBN3367157.1 hypothetical protein [Clostridium botulinum]MBN3376606.1 hypothetical protein [Clostridium botulinum]
MSDRLSELQKELDNNLYKATIIAKKNTKRNEMGQVIISEDEEEKCEWDIIADIFTNAIRRKGLNSKQVEDISKKILDEVRNKCE